MANHKSAIKRIAQTKKRNARNTDRESRIRTMIKKFLAVLKSGGDQEIQDTFTMVQSEIQKAVSKGVLHKNTASRKVARLHKMLKNRV